MNAAVSLEYFLCANHFDASVVEAAELLHYRHPGISDAVVIIVSRSGESIEITRLIHLFKGRQKIIAISNELNSTLTLAADVSIHIGSLSDQMVAIQTYTGTLLTSYLLGCAVRDSPNEAADEIMALLPSFSQLVAATLLAMGDWDGFLDNRSPVHLLARGPSCSSALEGALLFNEIAKVASVSMPVASFRHGPVELVDKDFRGLIFAPHGHTQKLNFSLADDIVRFGGKVRVIGPDQPSSSIVEWCPIPAVPEMLSPIFDIVPIQVAALRKAKLTGIIPGSFRYTPQVATSEATFGSPDANADQQGAIS